MRKTFREIAKKAAGGALVLAMVVTSLGAPGVQAATKSKNYVSPYEGKKYVFATNYNNGIYAYNKKGKLVKNYTVVKGIDKEYSMGAVYKTKSYLYFCDTNEGYSQDGNVWQIPINKKTEKLNVKKKKKLFHVKDWDSFVYATDTKIVFNRQGGLYSYNKRTKKRKDLTGLANRDNIIYMAKDSSGRTVKVGNCVYYTVVSYGFSADGSVGLFELNLKTGNERQVTTSVAMPWRLRYGHEYGERNPILGVSGSNLYIQTASKLIKYNTKTKKTTTLMKNKNSNPLDSSMSIDNCVTANAGVDNIKEWDILGIRCCGKKLYLEVRIKYNFSTPSSDSYQEYGNKYELKNIMLSMNKKDGSNLVYEADLSKFLASHDGENKDSDYDGINNWTNHTGSMMSVTSKGVWLAEFVNEKGNRSYFTYNMKTKKHGGYSKKKAKLELIKRGIQDDATPLIC